MALPKEKVAELLKNITPKSESTEDKLLKLLESVKEGSGGDNMLPFMIMAMTGGNKGGMDMEKAFYLKAMKDLFKDDSSSNDLSKVLKEMDERMSARIEKSEERMIQLIKELVPKPESETDKLLKEVLNKLSNGNGKDDVNTAIELAKIFKTDSSNQKDPIDVALKLHEMNKDSMKEVNEWKERYFEDKNKATQSQLEQALEMIRLNQNNNDFMTQLQNATTTLDKFKSFATSSGLIQQPDPNVAKEGKLDWKYIMKTISEVISNVAPQLKPPEQKSNWNLDAEAERVYNQYKDRITREDGTPINKDFVKQELIKNPNVTAQWEYAIAQALKQYNAQYPEPEPEPEKTVEPEPEPEPEPVEQKEPEEKPVQEIKGRFVEPSSVG